MRTVVAIVLVLCAAAVAAGGVPRTASAHDELIATTPVDGSVVATSPAEILLEFSGNVSLPPNAVQVIGPGGKAIAGGDPAAEGGSVRASLPPGLQRGTYTVTWRAASADNHPISGSFVFSVGAPSAAAPAGELTEAGRGWEIAAGVIRFVGYMTALFAAGGVAFVLLAHDRAPTERRRFERVIAASGLIAALTTLPGMAVEVVILAGGGSGALSEGDSWRFVFESNYGASATLTAACGLVLAAWLLARARPAWMAGLPAAGLVAAFSVTGHSRTSDPGWLVLPANLIHTASVAFWLGGLALLVATLWIRRKERRLAGEIVGRFSSTALVSVALVAITGTAFGWAQLRSFAQIYESRYGQVLAFKVAVFLVVVAMAAWNNRRLVPRMKGGDRAAARQLMYLASAEMLCLVIVAAATAYLVDQPPPAGGHEAHGGAAHADHEQRPFYVGEVGELSYMVEVADGAVGPNTILVRLTHPDGSPADVKAATIEAALPARDIAPIERTLVNRGSGTYTTTVEIGIGGRWELTLNVRATEFEELRSSFTVDIHE